MKTWLRDISTSTSDSSYFPAAWITYGDSVYDSRKFEKYNFCSLSGYKYCCTRVKGHSGPHAAHHSLDNTIKDTWL